MWARIIRLQRYVTHVFALILVGIGISLPSPESAKAANPASTPDEKTIEQRVAAVRRDLREQQLRDNTTVDKTNQKSSERLTQWFNWPNWPNWGNWPNWPNWGNWFNR
jgi:hypothetical protein